MTLSLSLSDGSPCARVCCVSDKCDAYKQWLESGEQDLDANLIPDSSMEAEQGVASRAVKATLFARMLLSANGKSKQAKTLR